MAHGSKKHWNRKVHSIVKGIRIFVANLSFRAESIPKSFHHFRSRYPYVACGHATSRFHKFKAVPVTQKAYMRFSVADSSMKFSVSRSGSKSSFTRSSNMRMSGVPSTICTERSLGTGRQRPCSTRQMELSSLSLLLS